MERTLRLKNFGVNVLERDADRGAVQCRTAACDGIFDRSCDLNALQVARSQKAKGWELRAATSLARLWKAQGKSHDAHELLASIYNCLT